MKCVEVWHLLDDTVRIDRVDFVSIDDLSGGGQ